MEIRASTMIDVKDALAECFPTDQDLLSFWHIAAPASAEECVARTLEDIHRDCDRGTFKFYRTYIDQELAGYWGTEFNKYINLIFVKPKFRNVAFMQKFWTAMTDSLDTPFYTAVYEKNSPAVSFYTARKGKPKKQELAGKKAIIFEFDKEILCH